MKRILTAGVCLAAALAAPTLAAPLANYAGTWENLSSSGIVRVTIDVNGGVQVKTEGACTPTPCQWGSVAGQPFAPNVSTPAANDTQAIIARYNPGFANTTLVLHGLSGNTLRATTYTDFTDSSGRNDYTNTVALTRKIGIVNPGVRPINPGLTPLKPVKNFREDCIAFNPGQVSVANPNGSWKLVQGQMWMLDAGPGGQGEMNKAKAIVQHYKMNKQCFVGRPDASLNYWLVNDAAPAGSFPGEDCVSINPNGLTIQGSGSLWRVISNGNHSAFSAPTQAEAQEVINVIKYYQFTQSCFVGRPGPSMSYLRK